MAVTQLLDFTTGYAVTTAQEVASGAFVTIVPVFKGKPGKVIVELADSDGGWQLVKTLRSNPRYPERWQIRGPQTYRVAVRNAGADRSA